MRGLVVLSCRVKPVFLLARSFAVSSGGSGGPKRPASAKAVPQEVTVGSAKGTWREQAEALKEEAMESMKRGDDVAAEKQLYTALKLFLSNDPPAGLDLMDSLFVLHMSQADSYMQMGKSDRAGQCFKKGLTVSHHSNLLLAKLGRYEELARAKIAQGSHLQSIDPEGHVNMAETLLRDTLTLCDEHPKSIKPTTKIEAQLSLAKLHLELEHDAREQERNRRGEDEDEEQEQDEDEDDEDDDELAFRKKKKWNKVMPDHRNKEVDTLIDAALASAKELFKANPENLGTLLYAATMSAFRYQGREDYVAALKQLAEVEPLQQPGTDHWWQCMGMQCFCNVRLNRGKDALAKAKELTKARKTLITDESDFEIVAESLVNAGVAFFECGHQKAAIDSVEFAKGLSEDDAHKEELDDIISYMKEEGLSKDKESKVSDKQ